MGDTTTFPVLCGSVAGRASHLGVALHEAGYRALGLEYRYVAIGTDDLASAVTSMRELRWRGFGVSMPFKVAILSYLDDVSPEVKAIGACNTVVHQDNRLAGYNTDWRGALDSLREVGVNEPTTALIVGAGGAARAIAYGLKTTGCRVIISCRNRVAGDQLCADLDLAGRISIEEQGTVECELVVNATPVATVHNSPIDPQTLRASRALLDVVFSPRDTELVAYARELGLRVAPGWRMLLHQAVHQFHHYTGVAAPLEAMEPVLRDALA